MLQNNVFKHDFFRCSVREQCLFCDTFKNKAKSWAMYYEAYCVN